MTTAPLALESPRTTKGILWAVPVLLILIAVPRLVDPYRTIELAYGLVFAIAVLGFNLLLGYNGLLSFGHSAYFGVGAYAVAFMVKYLHVNSMELFLVGTVAMSVLVTALFGYVCVRYTKIFFSILTLSLSQVLWSLAFKFFWVTGGTDGLRVPTPKILGMAVGAGENEDKSYFLSHGYYYYVLAVFVLCVAVMWVIVHSPFGKALQAIRDNETRARFVGLQIRRYRFMAFLVSGVFTSIAGALWVPLNGLTTPDILYWPFSGEIVFMAVLGGFRNFTGPILGAVVYNFLKDYAVGFTVYWQTFMGVILVVLVMVLPTGIVGTAKLLWNMGRRRLSRP
jgi:branched-chain amino acid transport system permease protein